MTTLPLSRILPGQEAVVEDVVGGRGLVQRLDLLGIRRGVRLRVVSRIVFGGPVVVRIGRTELALGRGMARRILVTPEPKAHR